MNDASSLREELLALVENVGEHLRFARELNINALEDSERHINTAAPSAPTGSYQPLTKHPALQRNAAASVTPAAHASNSHAQASGAQLPPLATESILPAHAVHSAPIDTSAPHAFASATQRTSNANAPASTETDMATRNSKRSNASPDPTPAPQETLFGEVTPQDAASLPRPNETLEDIWADITPQCMRCTLCCEGRKQVVNSTGNRAARLMFVGEAPGADEDQQGRPFVGRAGQLLNKIIEAIGMKREDVFIGNVNRCRPANNRTPTPAEAKICKPFLLREIAVVQPEVIVVLGNTAMKNLLDTKEGITKLRGEFQDYRGIKVMPTFHPAYLLRDPTKKRETWDDMKKVREYLNSTQK